jgi:hypothetical protein
LLELVEADDRRRGDRRVWVIDGDVRVGDVWTLQ